MYKRQVVKSVVKVCGSTVKLQLILATLSATEAVSYTHLGVYKRQMLDTLRQMDGRVANNRNGITGIPTGLRDLDSPLINGVIDVVEGYVLTGFARLTEASLLIVSIAIGLSFTLLMVKNSLI